MKFQNVFMHALLFFRCFVIFRKKNLIFDSQFVEFFSQSERELFVFDRFWWKKHQTFDFEFCDFIFKFVCWRQIVIYFHSHFDYKNKLEFLKNKWKQIEKMNEIELRNNFESQIFWQKFKHLLRQRNENFCIFFVIFFIFDIFFNFQFFFFFSFFFVCVSRFFSWSRDSSFDC